MNERNSLFFLLPFSGDGGVKIGLLALKIRREFRWVEGRFLGGSLVFLVGRVLKL